jgi:hypothetical protein
VAPRRPTGRGSSSATPEPRPTIETNPEGAVKILERHYATIEKLDQSDQASVSDAQKYLLDDVGTIFGVGNAEWTQIWQNPIYDEPFLLGTLGGEDDFDEGSWHGSNKAKKVKAGIDQMLSRLRRLIERARDRGAQQGAPGGSPMEPLAHIPREAFLLIKPDGARHPGKGIWDTSSVMVLDRSFPVAQGDTIERTLPNGTVMRYEVTDPGFQKGMGSLPDHCA